MLVVVHQQLFARHREHTSAWLAEHPDAFAVGFVEAAGPWAALHRPELNFAVNYAENLDLLREGAADVAFVQGGVASALDRAQLDAAEPPDPNDPFTRPKVEELGNQRYRIGSIKVDKARGSFTVPGAILRDKPPLEFLAVMKAGSKAYERLVELDSSAIEFNLACILIGLDPEKGKAPRFHFDREPVEGDAVQIWVRWERDGKTERVDAAVPFEALNDLARQDLPLLDVRDSL